MPGLYSACVAVHSLGAVGRALGGLAIALGIGAWGWRRSSLSGSGAAAAVLVGWGTLASSFRSGLLLLTFFFASSKITQASRLAGRQGALRLHFAGGAMEGPWHGTATWLCCPQVSNNLLRCHLQLSSPLPL